MKKIKSRVFGGLRWASGALLVSVCMTYQIQAQGLPKSPFTNAVAPPPVAAAVTNEISFSALQTHDEKAKTINAYQEKMERLKNQALAELVKTQNDLKEASGSDGALRQVAQSRQDYFQQLFDGYADSVDTLKDMRRLNDKLVLTQKENDSWVPPTGTPPWEISVADDLRFAIMQEEFQANRLSQRLIVLGQEVEDRTKSLNKAEIELRQSNGKDNTTPGGNALDSTGVYETAKRRLDLISLSLSNTLLDKDLVSAQRQDSLLRLSALKKTWAYYDNRFIYSDDDLKKTLDELNNKIAALRTQEQQASVKINRTLDLAASAKAKFEQLQSTPNTSSETIAQAKQDWLESDTLAQSTRIEREKYRGMIELNSALIQMWTLRHTIYNADKRDVDFNEIKTQQADIVRRLDQGLQYLTQIIAEKSQSLFELNEQLKVAKDPAERESIKNLIRPVNEAINNTRELYSEVGRVRQMLQITDDEIKSSESKRSLNQIFNTFKITFLSIGKSIWNYEILAVDDVMVLDGREVKTKRSVTIGKSVGALFILIVGFMVISRIIRRTLQLAVSKGNLGASKSVIIGRWMAIIAGIALIVTAFNLVEIPLSAFAFFGGALAIGVGFGTQNILKNLISGVMLLIERPIRIGDLVEVDGVTGTVTSIGIRFSTIHGAHGTDTLIPNSALVEQKLVNWTYSTPDIRKDIKLTVGYNSDVQQVKDILLTLSNAHPNVIRTPSPLVTLDDFGDNGLLFNLQVWMKIEAGLNSANVLSELRLQILEAFRTAEIDLPYPQRVMQLDKNASIEVRMAAGQERSS
jgi:small-conductance mechanosensitive channel